MTAVFLTCTLIFGAIACFEGLRETYRGDRDANKKYLLHCARLAAETIRGAPVLELAGDSESARYQELCVELDKLRENMELKYVYIYVPAEDGKTLTVIAVSGMEAEEAWSPGQVIEEEIPEEAQAVYRGEQESGWKISRNQYGYVVTVYRPVYDSGGKIQAVAGADLERTEIVSEFFRQIRWIWSWILIGCGAVFFLLSYLNRRLVIHPVVELSEHMKHFVQEKEEKGTFSRIEVKSRDEVGRMAETFNQMAGDLEYYLNQTVRLTAAAEKEKTEMETARRIQKASLPDGKNPFPEDRRFSLSADMTAAREVGGDFYDYFRIGENKLCTVIGDVSGKGIGAALFMMRAMTLIKERAWEKETLSEVLAKANDELCARNSEGMFVTLFIGILDLDTGRYRYACAGHNPPYVCKVGSKALEVGHSVPLGIFEEEAYEEAELELQKGERIFLYTDGVTEAMNEDRKLFGELRMQEVLNAHMNQSCEEMLDAMKKAVSEFAGQMEQSDDITMLTLMY